MAARLEQRDFPGRALTHEEKALREVLAVLIQDFDGKNYSLPDVPQASDLVNGRRAISKAPGEKAG